MVEPIVQMHYGSCVVNKYYIILRPRLPEISILIPVALLEISTLIPVAPLPEISILIPLTPAPNSRRNCIKRCAFTTYLWAKYYARI